MKQWILHLNSTTFLVADLDSVSASGGVWVEIREGDRKIVSLDLRKGLLRKAHTYRGREALLMHVDFALKDFVRSCGDDVFGESAASRRSAANAVARSHYAEWLSTQDATNEPSTQPMSYGGTD